MSDKICIFMFIDLEIKIRYKKQELLWLSMAIEEVKAVSHRDRCFGFKSRQCEN